MFYKDPSSERPFWLDDPNPYLPSSAGSGWWSSPYSRFGTLVIFAWQILLILSVVGLMWHYPWLWLVAAYLVFTVLLTFAMRLRQKQTLVSAAEIQQLAKERTGASTIGSAIHTAGHPLLQPNQPVVLALKENSLSIYSYQSAEPLDTILLADFQAIELVTYDDDGVPHVGVVDSTAQALQVEFRLRGQVCKCLFRRMYKVRAVGWYQAIQAARVAIQPV